MINMIKRDARLAPCLREQIEDEGISVGIDDALSADDYVAIKVDDYYASLALGDTPKSVDFVVVVDCQCNAYAMYILEFKNVRNAGGIHISEIQEKFENTINDFLSDSFATIFMNDRFKYKNIKLYLVSDAYHETGRFINHAEAQAFRDRINKRDSLKVDMQSRQKLFHFRNKVLQIEYDIPPNPVISRV